MKQVIGYALLLAGMAGMARFLWVFTVYRYDHPTLTQTQLSLWASQYWWTWIPAIVGAVIGMAILNHRQRTKG